MSPYLAFIKSSLLGMLAYRLRYFTGIITYLLYVTIHYFIWQAVFRDHPGTINGFTFPEMITYITVAWIARSLYFSNIDYEIDEVVKSGQIGIYLLRPVRFQLMMMAQAIGETCFRLVFFTFPIGIVILLIFPVQLPHSLMHSIGFLCATVMSFFVLAEINFLIGIVAVYFKSISNVMQAKHYIIQLLSGLLLPLSFFPPWAEKILSVLPFQMMTYVPLQIYLGKLDGTQMSTVLFEQLLWLIVLFILGERFWRKASAHLVVQGG